MKRVDVEAAEIVVLNTCTVTSAADQDARAAIRRIRRQRPEAKLLITGCYAQRAPEEIAQLEGVTWVVGNSHKHRIGEIVSGSVLRAQNGFVPLESLSSPSAFAPGIYATDIFAHTELVAAPVFDDIARTRPNLKVQDGCDNRCSFCVIPFVRGHSRSLPLDDVLREVDTLERAGYREVVISGINLGRWGHDFSQKKTFIDLIRAILDRSSVQKFRISSVEPMDWTDDLIGLMASSDRLAKHAHVPLQSGSDHVLRRMYRKYRPWHYAEKLEKIRSAMPDAAIGADVMAGFPGESEQMFHESCSFMAGLPLTYLHVFTYSPRPGTPAATMPGQVPIEVARDRNRVLRELAADKNLAFRRNFLGKTLKAITLGYASQGWTEALTDNYLKLKVEGEHDSNQWLQIQISGVTESGLSGNRIC
jgi:threonylcarbamoyladenosine tRNA methylthiotransferase MtaB